MQDDQTPDNPPVKRDWAAIRAQNEAAFQGGLDRVTAAYQEQRDAPVQRWANEFKAEAAGRIVMHRASQQLIALAEKQDRDRHVAALATMSSFRGSFSEAAYCVPRGATTAKIFDDNIKGVVFGNPRGNIDGNDDINNFIIRPSVTTAYTQPLPI